MDMVPSRDTEINWKLVGDARILKPGLPRSVQVPNNLESIESAKDGMYGLV